MQQLSYYFHSESSMTYIFGTGFNIIKKLQESKSIILSTLFFEIGFLKGGDHLAKLYEFFREGDGKIRSV